MLRSRQPTVVLVAAMLAMLAVLAIGCSPAGSEPVELTAADSGSTKSLAVGQELIVTLASNQTTGYRWAVDGVVPPQLKQIGEPSYSSESALVGAGGQEVWAFRGAQPGLGVVRLKYWRSFEPTAEPAETFAVTVNVK
jgi:inhibitor of cysteine peptidase